VDKRRTVGQAPLALNPKPQTLKVLKVRTPPNPNPEPRNAAPSGKLILTFLPAASRAARPATPTLLGTTNTSSRRAPVKPHESGAKQVRQVSEARVPARAPWNLVSAPHSLRRARISRALW